jgi:hypothetical protein
MTNWRDNADRIRKKMMDAVIEGLKKEMEIFRGADLAQMADAMPEPPPGHLLELKVSTPDCALAATITRGESWRGVAYMDLRGLSPEFAEAYLEYLYRGNAALLNDYLKSEKPLNKKERKRMAGLLPKGSKTGRPRNLQIRGAADLAWRFYRWLQKTNKAFASG